MTWDTLIGSSIRVALRSFDATRTARTLLVAAVVGPVLQVVYFAALATLPGRNPPIATAVTASLLVAAIGAVESVTVGVTRMRQDGVLPYVLVAPRSASVVWIGATIASGGVGLLAGLVSLTAAFALFGAGLSWEQYISSAGIIAVTAIASGGFGFAVGAMTLPVRNGLAWVVPIVGLMTVLGGIVAPTSELPAPALWIARLLPISFGTDAVRAILSEGSSGSAALAACGAFILGSLWFVAGHFGWGVAARRMRRSGTIDLL